MHVPLAFRVPRPPTIFVGRDREVSRIGSLLARESVVSVAGPEGVGKTAVVAAALERAGARASAIYVRARATDGLPALLCDLLHVMSPAPDDAPRARELARAVHHRDLLLSAVLDVAERAACIVVLDDAHHVEPEELELAIDAFERFAARARLCVVGRRLPRAREHECVDLRALTHDELADLAAKLEPELSASARSQALAACHGSPWLLRRGLEAVAAGLPPSAELVTANLDDAARVVLALLVTLRVPLSRAAARSIQPRGDDAVAALLARGLAVEDAEGVRLHESAAPLLQTLELVPALRRNAARVLADDARAEWTLEAARLLAADDAAAAEVLLAERGPALLASGHGARLARILAALPSSSSTEYEAQLKKPLGCVDIVQPP